MMLNLRKSEFGKEEIKSLGHRISVEGITTDPEKVKAIQEFPTPKNCKQLKSFLGLANYYQRFTSKYAESTVPLLKLLNKGIKWKWTKDHDEALQQLKSPFINTVVLHHPRVGERFYLQTDARKCLLYTSRCV